MEGIGGEYAEDRRAMRLAAASQCSDPAVIKRLFERDEPDLADDAAATPLSDDERETLSKFEASLRDRRERGELL